MKRYLEFVGQDSSRGVENSSKFWEAWVEAETLHTRFGKIGATGQTTIKAFPSSSEAELALEKALAAKFKKGYVEKVGGGTDTVTPATGPALDQKLGSMIECIACAEDIKVNAKLCKHCGTKQDDVKFLSSERFAFAEDVWRMPDEKWSEHYLLVRELRDIATDIWDTCDEEEDEANYSYWAGRTTALDEVLDMLLSYLPDDFELDNLPLPEED